MVTTAADCKVVPASKRGGLPSLDEVDAFITDTEEFLTRLPAPSPADATPNNPIPQPLTSRRPQRLTSVRCKHQRRTMPERTSRWPGVPTWYHHGVDVRVLIRTVSSADTTLYSTTRIVTLRIVLGSI